MNCRFLAAALGVIAISWCNHIRGAETRPNFIVINIDDLGYADIGPFGSKLNRTPNLDRMAAEGCKLTCFYAAPVCSPSRAALMTGCYPKRALPIPGVLFPAARVGLNPDERTIADLLKEVGYATACIGKWHLGDQPEFLPTRQGFDYYFGIPYSNDMGPAEDGAKSNLGEPIRTPKKADEKADANGTGLRGNSQPPLPLVENERAIERVRAAEQQTLTQRFTEKCLEFMQTNKDRPFFIYLPYSAVHSPCYPAAEFHGKSNNGIHGDWVEEIDARVGAILNKVRDLGLSERTLVLFTSDNGGTKRSINTPLRGGKTTTWEGGMRVPTLAWRPGTIPGGSTIDAMTGMMDVSPTIVTMAGGTVPSDRKIDGVDIGPLLTGRADAKPPRDVFYFFDGFKLQAVRHGPWKLHLASGELHNLDADIGEANNVASSSPEIVSQLRDLANAMDADLGIKEIGPGCRPLGKVAHPRPLLAKD